MRQTPYRTYESKKQRKPPSAALVAVTFSVIAVLLIASYFILQSFIVFTSDGVTLDFSFLNPDSEIKTLTIEAAEKE